MLIEAFNTSEDAFHWLDILDPTGSELEEVAKKYDLPLIAIRECLDPKALPRFETIEQHQFLLLRTYNEKSKDHIYTLSRLTQRLGIFIGQNYLITIHRRDQPFITQIRNEWIRKNKHLGDALLPKLLGKIIYSAIATFGQGIHHCQIKHEEYEHVLFKNITTMGSLQEKFLIKQKLYVFKKILKIYLNIIPKTEIASLLDIDSFHHIKEIAKNQNFEVEQMLDNINNLINLNLSLASHYTGDIIRTLTVYTVFFMPLNFICYIFSMGFMPGRDWRYGVPIVLSLMLSCGVPLYLHFKRKGWI